ncbi:MAG: MarR family transcriptional regulator [Hungatella sp.]
MDQKQKVRDLMFRTEMARKQRLHPIWNEMGLIAGQPRVLSQLLIRDHETQKELADACCIEPATLSRALDKLESMGYISRNDNPECRRSFLIALTEEGRPVAQRVCEVFREIEGRMVTDFSEEEIGEFITLISRMYENLRS